MEAITELSSLFVAHIKMFRFRLFYVSLHLNPFTNKSSLDKTENMTKSLYLQFYSVGNANKPPWLCWPPVFDLAVSVS